MGDEACAELGITSCGRLEDMPEPLAKKQHLTARLFDNPKDRKDGHLNDKSVSYETNEFAKYLGSLECDDGDSSEDEEDTDTIVKKAVKKEVKEKAKVAMKRQK